MSDLKKQIVDGIRSKVREKYWDNINSFDEIDLTIQHLTAKIEQAIKEMKGKLDELHSEGLVGSYSATRFGELSDELLAEIKGGEVTLCRSCNCMSKTIEGKCGKCGGEKL